MGNWGTFVPLLVGDVEVCIWVLGDYRIEGVSFRKVALVEELAEILEARFEASSQSFAVHYRYYI